MLNNVDSVVLSSLNSFNDKIDSKAIILSFKNNINSKIDSLLAANQVDISNHNGKVIDIKTINRIISLILEENVSYGSIIASSKDKERKIFYGKKITNIGNICTIFDGNTYTLIELILRNIIVNNSVVFNYSGYNRGANGFVIKLIKDILLEYKLNANMFNEYISSGLEILKRYTNFNLVIAVGNKELQSRVLKESRNKVLLCGYDNVDIYIDSLNNMSFIKEINDKYENINLYYKEGIKIRSDYAISVSGIDEAIGRINLEGSGYHSAIFTNNSDNASKFLKEVNSKYVMVNASPTLESFLDILERDLYIEKTIIYPFEVKIEDEIKIE